VPTATTTSANDAILKKLLPGPKTRSQLHSTRYRLLMLIDQKLIKRAGEVKQGSARKAVVFDLTAKGRKRAEKV
jgi:hypothetical protein